MKTFKYIFAALSGALILSGIILSCKKSDGLTVYTFDATIHYAGQPASDGCDWQVIADSTYHPLNLSSDYQVEGMKVSITFQKPGPRYYCDLSPSISHGVSDITIVSIRAH